MENHLGKCVFNPEAPDTINKAFPSKSQLLSFKLRAPCQTVLSLETKTQGQQIITPQQVNKWEHDVLCLFTAMEAKFNAANHSEVTAFFTKYCGRANLSAWVLSN